MREGSREWERRECGREREEKRERGRKGEEREMDVMVCSLQAGA